MSEHSSCTTVDGHNILNLKLLCGFQTIADQFSKANEIEVSERPVCFSWSVTCWASKVCFKETCIV